MVEELKKGTGWISHALVNTDESYSVMRHSVCEYCDYCKAEEAGYKSGMRNSHKLTIINPFIHVAKEDAYFDQNKENNAAGFMGDFLRMRRENSHDLPEWFNELLNSWFKEFSKKMGYTEIMGQEDPKGETHE